MTHVALIWLGYVVATGLIALYGNVRQAIMFVLAVALLLPLQFTALGNAAIYGLPRGELTVIGARIDVDKAIYVLINGDPEPRYFKLPYTPQKAGDLQKAMDGARNGRGKVKIKIRGDGSFGFAEETPKPDAVKQ